MTIFEKLSNLLLSNENYQAENADGQKVLNKTLVSTQAREYNPELLTILQSDEEIKNHFFVPINSPPFMEGWQPKADGVVVFKLESFLTFINNHSFLPDSFTAYKNRIGLATDNTELDNVKNKEYTTLLRDIITDIKSTRVVVAHKINSAMMQLYWNIGRRLSTDVAEKGYGSSVVKRLSADLTFEFPDLSGFSPRNLWNMKNFYEFYKLADEKVQRSVALLPWRHNILIFSKIRSLKEAEFYIESALEFGWTHDILLNFIKADTYKHQKLEPKTHNFLQTLPEHLQDQADEILKSKYNVSFIGSEKPLKERELEKRLVEKIKYFLLELGIGFSFMGNQYRVTRNEKEYFVDMLFFNRKLHSLIAIDLKIGCFEPEYVGKMNYYLGILDDQVKQDDENSSIGIILCAYKGQVDIELALRDFNKPIAVAEIAFDFPEKEIKELINSEVEAYQLEKLEIEENTKNEE